MYYENFAKLCKERDVTANKVSKGTGISTATLTNWKKGTYTPKRDKMQKIADFFNISIDVLYGKESEVKSTNGTEYYFDDETARLAEEMYKNDDLRMLADSTRKMSPEDIKALTAMAQALIRKEKNEK